MTDPIKETAKIIAHFFEKLGIDPLFVATVFAILLAFSYKKVYENWDKTPAIKKRSAIITLIGAILCIIISLYKIIFVY